MAKLFIPLVIFLNILSFALMGIDKRRAQDGRERISEKTLLLSGFILGGPGLLLGALVWHHKTRKLKFRLGIPLAILFNLILVVFVLSTFMVIEVSGDILYSCEETSDIDAEAAETLKDGNYQCALILGCGVYADGSPTPMLRDRLETGITLYKEGLVPRLLLSGDHGQVEYNEIGCMYSYCLNAGIPEEDIFLDHAGFSTYDSVFRAQSIFRVERMIIVTQKYHEFRALFIADRLGIDAVGVSSDQQRYFGSVYREFREVLARDKDYFKAIMKASPVFGGEEIPITGSSAKSHE